MKITDWLRELSHTQQMALRYVAAFVLTLAFLSCYAILFGSSHPYLVGLFPVILCAVFLGSGPGAVSLGITTLFILRFQIEGERLIMSALAVSFFLIEGLVVIWIAHKRRLARAELAEALQNRSRELDELKTTHHKLSVSAHSQNQSIEQLKRSNQTMLDTLERILGKPNR